MKRFIALLLTFVIGCSLVACSAAPTEPVKPTQASQSHIGDPGYVGTSDQSGSAYDPELQKYVDAFADGIKDIVPYTSITVSCKEDKFSTSVVVEGKDKVTYFGNYIVTVKTTFESQFEESKRGGLSVALKNDGKDLMAYFNRDFGDTKAGEYGIIVDRRTGSFKYKPLDTVESLYKIFPATKTFIKEQEIDPAILAIYKEVMDALDKQPSRSEDEILEEMAPRYDMTAEELKNLIQEVMEKLYS